MIAPPAPASHLRFARTLLQAMGLGSMAAALATGCGGNVILDIGNGGGPVTVGNGGSPVVVGNGGSPVVVGNGGGGVTVGNTTTTVGAGGSSPAGCNVPPPPGDTIAFGCLQQTSECPSMTDQTVYDQLAMELNQTSGCGSGSIVQQVLCGPDPTRPGCCYEAALGPALCEGRPFTVEGRARTAPAVARAGFAAALAPDVSRLDAPTRRALAEAWERDARYEHASIASFARFTLELLAAGAPAALLAEAHRALGDEIRHAELCFGLAGAYAGAERGPGPLPTAGALAGRDDLASLAAAAVEEGCVGETIAALVAEAQRDAAEDPAVRSALARIAEDEAAHAALAWRFVAWAVAEGPAEVAVAVAEAFAQARAHTMVIEGGALAAGADAAAMRAHGRLGEDEVRAIAEQAWGAVILPCAQALAGADA